MLYCKENCIFYFFPFGVLVALCVSICLLYQDIPSHLREKRNEVVSLLKSHTIKTEPIVHTFEQEEVRKQASTLTQDNFSL